MSLTPDEVTLVQDAIFDGAFSPVIQNESGISRSAPNADTARAVRAMADEDVRVVLRAYQSGAISSLINNIAKQQTKINTTQAKLTTLKALVVTPAPVAPSAS